MPNDKNLADELTRCLGPVAFEYPLKFRRYIVRTDVSVWVDVELEKLEPLVSKVIKEALLDALQETEPPTKIVCYKATKDRIDETEDGKEREYIEATFVETVVRHP